MLSTYNLLLFLHLAAVAVWLGGGVMLDIVAGRMMRTNDPEAIARVAEESVWLGKRYFSPAALITLGAGIGLVLTGQWGFERPWIAFGIAAVVISSVLGMAYYGKEGERLAAEARERGSDEGVLARRNRLRLVSRLETAMLFLVVVAMTFKPEF